MKEWMGSGSRKIDISQAACSLPKLGMETDKLICSLSINAKDDWYVCFNIVLKSFVSFHSDFQDPFQGRAKMIAFFSDSPCYK